MNCMKRIYLDNAATTPTDGGVRKEMSSFMKNNSGNPSSIHREGVLAKKAIENARVCIAKFFNARNNEIIFTGSGTEANNIAIQGVFETLLFDGPLSDGRRTSVKISSLTDLQMTDVRRPSIGDFHAVTSVIEHPSVIETFRALEKKGLSVTYVPVDESGHVNAKDVKEALRENTVLVSIMYANNEIGTVQPIKEIAKVIRWFRKTELAGGGQTSSRPAGSSRSNLLPQAPLFHTDACQAVNYLDMNIARLGVDLLSMSVSKIYGPKGVGVLYVKKGIEIAPIMYGGGQEMGIRSGTENTAGIIGASVAFFQAKKMKEKEAERLTGLRAYFVTELREKFPKMVSNGDGEVLPNIINISFPHFDNEELVLRLSAKGIAVSAKSACKSSDENVSYVVQALGNGHYPESAIRFSLGRHTSKKDIDYTIKKLKEIFITINKK